jgi:hypothetical protein
MAWNRKLSHFPGITRLQPSRERSCPCGRKKKQATGTVSVKISVGDEVLQSAKSDSPYGIAAAHGIVKR